MKKSGNFLKCENRKNIIEKQTHVFFLPSVAHWAVLAPPIVLVLVMKIVTIGNENRF